MDLQKKLKARLKLERYNFLEKKLNLGCGYDIREGWVNLDMYKNKGVDVAHDLNHYPYPFKKNYFDLIFSWNSLEHLKDADKGIRELHRILKPGGLLIVHVPYFNAAAAYKPTHFSFFSRDSFFAYTEKFREQAGLEQAALFKIKRLELIPTRLGKLIPKFLRYHASLVLGEIIHSIEAEMVALKR